MSESQPQQPHKDLEATIRDSSPEGQVMWVVLVIIVGIITIPLFNIGGIIVTAILARKVYRGLLVSVPYDAS